MQADASDNPSQSAQVGALLDAVIALGSGLDLSRILHGIVAAAVKLVDCRYGALGIVGADSQIIEFLTVGVDAETRAKIGDPPHGEGILGVLIHEPKPLRLDDLSQHPAASGFPPNHPPMKTFLGVPVRVYGEVYGNLYLTEKNGGIGFGEADEKTILALAAAAGVAIENARLYADVARNQASLQASADITTALLSGEDTDEVINTVAERARELVGTEMALIAFPDQAGHFVIEVCVGAAASEYVGVPLPLDDSSAHIVSSPGEGAIVPEFGIDEASSLPAMLVPLTLGPDRHAVLVVVDKPGRVFDTEMLHALESFSAQAAVALELADARKRAESHVVFEDRDRIARDLHDLVIQRLFAAGMHLQSTMRMLQSEETITRVQGVIDDLDQTIREIRSTIFGLQTAQRAVHRGLAAQVIDVIDECAELLDCTPGVELVGISSATLDNEVVTDLLAALREMLSNVARHAQATELAVTVSAVGGNLEVCVTDDGVGIPGDIRRSGLVNLADRAVRHGGAFVISPGESGGTRALWSVPLLSAGH